MTKDEVLSFIQNAEWTDDIEAAIGCAIGRFVVYQEDADTGFPYGHQYFFTEEDARKDFETRQRYSSGFCFCVLNSMNGNDLYERRTLFGS